MILYGSEMVQSLGFKSPLYIADKTTILPLATLLEKQKHKAYYATQPKPGGIAQAISLAKDFIQNEPFLVLLGDNIILDASTIVQIRKDIQDFQQGCHFWVKSVQDPKDYGVYDPVTKSIEEKPAEPKSNYAIIGLYLFDDTVWSKIESLKPSARGELEVADLLNAYIKEGRYSSTEIRGKWFDLGRSQKEYNAISALLSTALDDANSF